MYKVIKSANFADKPHIIKAPEPLFIVKSAVEKKESDKDKALREESKIHVRLKELADKLQKKENELGDLDAKADLIIKDARKNKEDLLKEADEKANKKIDEANKKIDEIKKKASEAGFREGLEKAKKEQEKTIKEANEKAVRIINEAEKEVNDYYQRAENDIADIVMEVSDKILSKKFADMPQLILPVVQKALLKVKNQTTIEVRVSQNAYEFAVAAKSELQNILEGNVTLTINPDDSLSDGDCWVETPDGSVDAKLLSQITEVGKALKKVVGKYALED